MIARGLCNADKRTYVGGTCGANSCTLGECCLANGDCVSTLSVDCASPNRFHSAATCGSVNTCPQPGVCCIGALCSSTVSQSSCVAPSSGIGAAFAAGTSACNGASQATSPCCYSDFNKSGSVTVQDIFDFLGAWFMSSPYAHVGGDGVQTPSIQDIFSFLADWFGGGCT